MLSPPLCPLVAVAPIPTVSAENLRILEHLPTRRICLLVIYCTFEAIYDPSEQWTAQLSELEDLAVDISPLSPPTHGFGHVIPIVGERFFDFFPSMTSFVLRNVHYLPYFQRISVLRRLTWTTDTQCELDSFSFASFYNPTDIQCLKLDVPNLRRLIVS